VLRASDRTRYQIAVKHETAGRGGSSSMIGICAGRHSVGITATNYFALDGRPHIRSSSPVGSASPILAMARNLRAQDAPFELIYCARSAERGSRTGEPAFADRTMVHYDGGDPAASLDFHARLAEHPPGRMSIAAARGR